MEQKQRINLYSKIDFGDIDGLYDKNISDYFLDNDYWSQLVEGDKYYVIGRKGTGKSAIYNWIKLNEGEKGAIVSNLSFRNFPFERLLNLSDDDFSRPNQYQSVWRNIILSEIAKDIVVDANSVPDEMYRELKEYVEFKFGRDLLDLHKRVASQTVKTERGLFLEGINNVHAKEASSEYDFSGMTNITLINQHLERVIREYLIITKSSRYIIQFDQLDDNYTVYITNDNYFQALISLFKVIYDLNQSFSQIDAPVKIIGYLRSDIFYEINNYDAESARWDMHQLYLNWAIINRTDWENPPLLQLLNKRIEYSIPQMRNVQNPFYSIFRGVEINTKGGARSVFSYVVRNSFQRPRDIIQFCKKIQEESKKSGRLDENTVFDAEKSYSMWLLAELSNEFGPLIKAKPVLYDFLREMGDEYISYEELSKTYVPYEESIGLSFNNLMDLLYRLGIVFNVNLKNPRRPEFFSIIRNEHSLINSKMRVYLNPGFRKGLHIYSK